VSASAAQKPSAAETMAGPAPIWFWSSQYCAASRMPSPAMVKGLTTVRKIWIEDAKVTGQNSAAVAPMASAVK
jgi:hypothetical protein